jgi:hypothetical protein
MDRHKAASPRRVDNAEAALLSSNLLQIFITNRYGDDGVAPVRMRRLLVIVPSEAIRPWPEAGVMPFPAAAPDPAGKDVLVKRA